MTVFLLTLLFLICVIAAMAVGVIFSNKPIKGSCGGMQSLGFTGKCDICGGDTQRCEEEQRRNESGSQPSPNSNRSAEFYDASRDR